jgi:serine/threonine protein kinase/streptogramin lyase
MGVGPSSERLVGSELAGYRIEALIGRGGMGAVYRAREAGLERMVALKVIAPELAEDERFLNRFLRESKIAASLDHPHVVPIHRAGEESGLLFIAMRYVEGTDLAKLLAQEGALDPRRAVAILEQVAEALDAAHEQGLVHRDVKPSNVLIAAAAGREHCYLADFGLTKRTGSLSGVSAAGDIVGTLEYIAPEQITGDEVDARSDLYSLGCVLYECLTGQAPFPRATDVALLWAHVHEEPTPPSQVRPELPSDLDGVLASALDKEPERRYRSAGELVAATRSALRLVDVAPAERESDELDLRPGQELRDLKPGILQQDDVLSAARPLSAAEPVRPPSTRRLSRRAVVVAGLGGLAAVTLGAGVTAFRSRASGGTQVQPGSVGVVDQITRELVDPIPVGFSSSLIAADAGAVWLVDPKGSTLTGIDPKTKAVFLDRQSIAAEGIPTGLAAGFGSVWIALVQGNALRVLEVGRELGNVRRRIVLEVREVPYSVFNTYVRLTVGKDAVWALERGPALVKRIDPATGNLEPFAKDVGAASSIAVDRDAVWLGGPDGVTKLDLRTSYELGSRLVVSALASTTTSIAVGRDAVWFVGDSSTDLWRIDPGSVEILESVPIGTSPSAVAVGEDGAVWIAGRSVTSLWRLDPKTNDDETITVGATSGGLVAAFDRIWMSPGAAAG